jgi:transcription elongation factor GreA-like protein
VAEWNLLLNQINIDFPGKKGHPMQLNYAADNLAVIPPAHFLARKATDLNGIKELLKKEPAAVVRNILESPRWRGDAIADQPAHDRRSLQ